MDDKELGHTKPIQIVGGNKPSREEKFEDVLAEEIGSREEKYQKMLEEEKAKEQEELAEEALARKNIELAEEYELEEKEALKEEIPEEEEEEPKEGKAKDNKDKKKKEKLGVKLGKWWASLDKTQKIIYGILFGLFLILFILLFIGAIVLINKNSKKEEPKKEEPAPVKEEAAPIMFDNYFYKEGVLHFLTEGGTEIGTYECTNKNEKLCTVAVNNYRDQLNVPRIVNQSGEDLVEYVAIVDDDFVFVNDTDTAGKNNIVLYSIKEKKQVGNYNDVKAYDGGYYAVSDKNDKYGLIQIDKEVKDLIRYQYEYLGMIDGENYLIAKENKGYIVIDKKDRGISKHIDTNEVKYYNNNFIITKSNGLYSVYNFKGEMLENGLSFATVNGKYMFLVDNNEVFVKDLEGTKYNEDGVPLNVQTYTKSYVYDENDQLLQTQRSFETEVKNGNIAVIVYSLEYDNPQYTNLSVAEGQLNKENEFVNYFDGSLYFYKDAEKKELIGDYKCTHKNEVSSSSKSFDSCFIARDTVFEDNDMTTDKVKNRKAMAAMMNNTFVFIKDGDDNIVLYDIASSTIKSSYLSINTYTEANDYKFTSASGSKELALLNKKGKYGVIKIDNTTVSPLYSFSYEKVEKLGDYFIGLETSGKWFIFANGQLKGVYPNKVAGYTTDLKYVKTNNGKNYNVYQFDGTPVTEENFYYIELFADFFVGVDSEKNVNVYDYEGKKLTTTSVKLGDVKINKTDNVPIKAKKAGEDYVVSIYTGGKYVDNTLSTKQPEPEPDPEPEPETPEEPETPPEPETPQEEEKPEQ